MVIFNSYVSHYQRVDDVMCHLGPKGIRKSGLWPEAARSSAPSYILNRGADAHGTRDL